MNNIIVFNVTEDQFDLTSRDRNGCRLTQRVSSVAIHANYEISLIALSGMIDYIEELSGTYDFEWCFKLNEEVPNNQAMAYLYPMVL